MSPGRAWSALTIWRSFCFASALRTQVWTAAHPLPGILWPACWSEYVTKLAHHGLPGPTPAAARYLSTSAPVLTPVSSPPSCVWAKLRADAPSVLEPEPGAAAAAASTMPGTDAAEATAPGGPAGGWTARDEPEPPFFASTTRSAAARNWPESPGLGSGGSAAAAAGAPGAGVAAAGAARGGGGAAAGPRGAPGAARPEQPGGLAEPQAVAAAVLRRRALAVRDPVAELVRVRD